MATCFDMQRFEYFLEAVRTWHHIPSHEHLSVFDLGRMITGLHRCVAPETAQTGLSCQNLPTYSESGFHIYVSSIKKRAVQLC
jgi:hypothetical protein